MKCKLITAILALAFLPTIFFAAEINVTDDDITAGSTVNWTADNTYILTEMVFVDDGATLNIEAGTVIKGMHGEAENASALIVARGGKIFAIGTPEAPIIFTHESDDPYSLDQPLDVDGQWGGVIILGKAPINVPGGVANIEGIPTTEPKGEFGGGATPDPHDNSGIFRYVSIRHGGTNIGANNEINGLTMGGVGDGTIIDHVEVFFNADDGFEWFGGTVNCSNLVSAFNSDDSFDHDFGWSGKCKNLFSIQTPDRGNHGAECSSNEDNGDAVPVAMPMFSNCTFIGSGAANDRAKSEAFDFKDGTGGTWKNNVFVDLPGDKPLNVEDKASGTDALQRLQDGELVLQNNVWYDIKNGDDAAGIAPDQAEVQAYLNDGANNNFIADALLRGIGREPNHMLDPRPALGSPALTNPWETMGDPWFDDEPLTYLGAFGANNLWIKGWTLLDFAGYIADGSAGSDIQVFDNSINPGDVVSWTKDNTYHLNGPVFVEEGAELYIEAGTVIKGKPGQGDQASALIIARGGKIFAEGTPSDPIIFTFEGDDPHDYNDVPLDISGQWGGVIILGEAKINVPGGTAQIEGIPSDNPKGNFGGNNDDDNSGVFRYVSIRHGGTDIGANNEINGLTMGGVGSGTTIDHVEVFRNADDGFEWFGGNVNCTHLISAFNNDDSYDHDFGYSGKGKFFFSIQEPSVGNHGAECSSNEDNGDATPVAMPMFSNVTFIGAGAANSRAKSEAFDFKDGTGGTWMNSIFTDFPGDKPVNVEDKDSGTDARQRLENGELVIMNNFWWAIKNGNTVEGIAPGQAWTQSYLADANTHNMIEDPMLNGVSRTTDNGLDPRLDPASPALAADIWQDLGDDWFDEEPPTYVGAFGANNLWIKGWTMLDGAGYIYEGSQGQDIQVYDTDINPGDQINWTANNIYHLNGFVFVEEGAELYIEEGTVIKGKPGQGDQASALIIARGGKIFAEGTEENPIIFTFEQDDPFDPTDVPMDVTGQWGGVIILGDAKINVPGGTAQIEGIPSDNPKGNFGGNNDDDNSGVFKYVSIRHGGTNIGANNEINGLTMGGVGRGTTIEHVEVYRNDDDGFEWFGGSVNCKNLVSAFNADDSYDHDFGWSGKLQFLFSIQEPAVGNHGGECSSNEDNGDATPVAMPIVYNATFIGAGAANSRAKSEAFDFKDGTGGTWMNSVFTDFPGDKPVNVEDKDSGTDSRQRLENGELVIQNNIWWGIKNGNTVEGIAPDQPWTQAYLSDQANHNDIVDPQLRSIGRFNGEILDPRPVDQSSPCYTLPKAPLPAGDNFFVPTDYIGAFGADNWLDKWTLLSTYLLSVEEEAVAGFATEVGIKVYPNPFSSYAQIEYSVERPTNVRLSVYNSVGEKVADLIDGFRDRGVYVANWTVEQNLPTGVYVVKLEANNTIVTSKVIVR